MAEVAAGVHPGRGTARDRIVVLSQGLVSQDVLLAHRLVDEALARGLGASVRPPWNPGGP
jgi:ornithine cyclodeaminase/alanine dehydrogenase-like protein (mu-crystallin family)